MKPTSHREELSSLKVVEAIATKSNHCRWVRLAKMERALELYFPKRRIFDLALAFGESVDEAYQLFLTASPLRSLLKQLRKKGKLPTSELGIKNYDQLIAAIQEVRRGMMKREHTFVQLKEKKRLSHLVKAYPKVSGKRHSYTTFEGGANIKRVSQAVF